MITSNVGQLVMRNEIGHATYGNIHIYNGYAERNLLMLVAYKERFPILFSCSFAYGIVL